MKRRMPYFTLLGLIFVAFAWLGSSQGVLPRRPEPQASPRVQESPAPAQFTRPTTPTRSTGEQLAAPEAGSAAPPCAPYHDDGRPVTASPAVPVLPPDERTERYKVLEVTDGDTLVVEKNGRTPVRLLGIDTPERSAATAGEVQHYGEEAFARTRLLIEAAGREVRLSHDGERGDWAQDLAYVWLADGRLLNGVLVAEGYAYASPGSRPRYGETFLALMREAREQQRGLWETCR